MLSATELNEYQAEIRKEVCSRCVERPPGGPPCAPQGKVCGIEMHLPEIITAIQEERSDSIVPYLEHNRATVCEHCAFHHASMCPCPMDYLAVLLVGAVEAVDRRQGWRRERKERAAAIELGEGD